METLVWIVNITAALALIGLVLLQHGKGADMGAAFGSGSSGSLFGAAGSANFLSRATSVAAAIFFSTCLVLAYFSAHKSKPTTVMESQKAVVQPAAPAEPKRPDAAGKAGEIPK
jgi:preprotein translocase subunit SecG